MSWCVCRWRGGNETAYFVCGLHTFDSAEHSPSMKQIYIRGGGNNLKPMLMLTLVCTRVHVALSHDYICAALNKMTHLTLSNNSAVIVAVECEIVFCTHSVHCHGSRSLRANRCLPYELLSHTHRNDTALVKRWIAGNHKLCFKQHEVW